MRYLFLAALFAMLAAPAFRLPDAFIVKGTVKDENGKPLAGASIQIKETKTRALSLEF